MTLISQSIAKRTDTLLLIQIDGKLTRAGFLSNGGGCSRVLPGDLFNRLDRPALLLRS